MLQKDVQAACELRCEFDILHQKWYSYHKIINDIFSDP